MIPGRINVALIRTHWSEILRVVVSIRTGSVIDSLIMHQLATHARQNGVAAALREVGKPERTLPMLDLTSTPALRRETGQEQQGRGSEQPGARSPSIGSARSAAGPTRTSSTAPPA